VKIIVSTIAVDCLESLILEMTYCVTSGMSNPTNSTQLRKFSSNGGRCQGNRHAAEAKLGISEWACTRVGEVVECDDIVHHLMLKCVYF